MACRRVRIWDCANLFTRENLVSVVSDSLVALNLGQDILPQPPQTVSQHSEGDSLFCTSCQVSISELSHYKSEWHRINAKLRAAGALPVSTAEFAALGLEHEFSDEEDYVEERVAQSGASSSNELEKQACTGSARITFVTKSNETLCVFKASLLAGKSNTVGQYAAAAVKLSEPLHPSFTEKPQSSLIEPNSTERMEKKEKALGALFPEHPFQWIVLLCQGGFFAGAVFHKDKVLKHKRIARYTVRRKQGGSQASKDASKGGIHSAGASIRRYNETKLREEIAQLMNDWHEEFTQASRIFIHAPSFNSASFFFEGSPISRRDPRVRHIPIITQRPSFVELQRVHLILSTVEVGHFLTFVPGAITTPNDAQSLAIPDANSLVSSSSSILSLTDGEHANWADPTSAAETSTSEDLLAAAIRINDIEKVRTLIEEENYMFPIPEKAEDLVWPLMLAMQAQNEPMVRCLIDCGENLDARSPRYNLKTVLHVACENAWDNFVEMLLEEGANPAVLDLYNRTAYDVCKDKSTRNLMRKFAGANPDLWDYNACRIPPLTEEMEEVNKLREAEKRKKKKAAQKERKKQQKVEAEKQNQQEAARLRANAEEALAKEAALERTKKMLTMSEREKRALAAERRLNPVALLCDNCGKSIQTTPFEKFSFKYCTSECVIEHKRILDTLQQSSSSK